MPFLNIKAENNPGYIESKQITCFIVYSAILRYKNTFAKVVIQSGYVSCGAGKMGFKEDGCGS